MTAKCALGIDIGGTTTKLAVVAASGEVLAMDTMATGCPEGSLGFVGELTSRIEALLKDRPSGNAHEPGIAVAIAGLIDTHRQQLIYSPNLAALVGVPLVKLLADRFDRPVVLDVDCNAACRGELRFGAGQGSRRLLSLAVGTGLGVGFAAEGEILRVAHECLGDAGHVIVKPGGPSCSAGCRGCAEALVSAGALESRYRDSTGGTLHAREIIDRALAGDTGARASLKETGYWLGVAMASLVSIFLPDRIVVSGGLAEAGALLLDPAVQSFRACAAPSYSEGVAVRPAKLGWRATVMGAAAMLL